MPSEQGEEAVCEPKAGFPLARREGPRCARCEGTSARAVRTQMAEVAEEPVYYLTYVWACTVCGAAWLDDGLARLNEWSADAARLAVVKAERWRTEDAA